MQSERTKEERVRVESAWTNGEERRKECTRPEKDEDETWGGRGGAGGEGETLLTPPSIQDGVGSGSPRH